MFHLDLGDGLELRHFEEIDAEAVFRVKEGNREQMRQWLPWVDRTHPIEDPRRFILKALEEYRKREAVSAGMFLGGELAGAFALHKIDALAHNASIGYWLDAQHRGRGFLTRACRAVVSHVFAQYGVEHACAGLETFVSGRGDRFRYG